MSPVSLRKSCLAVVLLTWSSVRCLAPDTNHCAHRPEELRGHAWCAERHPDLPLCSRCEPVANGNHGCIDREDRSECLVGEPLFDATPTTSESTAEDSTTVAMACVPAECAATSPLQPLCSDDDECVPCSQAGGDEGCAAVDPDRPACVTEGPLAGACVQCTEHATGACAAQAPICDANTHTCVACRFHAECLAASGSACRIETGECLPPELVRHVDASASGSGDGTPMMPYPTIQQALGDPALQEHGTIILHDGEYTEAPSIGGARQIAIVAADGTRPQLVGDTTNGLVVAVGDDTELYLEGLTLRANDEGAGLRVASFAITYVDRCELTENAIGVEITGGAALVLRNSIATTTLASSPAVSASDGATVDIDYSTLFNTATGGIDAVRCTPPVAVSVRNSIILARATSEPSGWSCEGGTVSHSAGENIPADGNADNLLLCAHPDVDCGVDAGITSLFTDLQRLRLTPIGAEIFLGVPASSTEGPTFDIDGNPRAPDRDFAGAHAPARR